MRPISTRPLSPLALMPLIALPALACLGAGTPPASPAPATVAAPAPLAAAPAAPTPAAEAARAAEPAAPAAVPEDGPMMRGAMRPLLRGHMAGRMGMARGMGGMGGPATCPMRAAMAGMAGAPLDPATLAARLADAEACPEPTEALAADGKKVFLGKGNCYTCHGMDAKGTPLAPNLVSHKWLNVDGTYPAIAKLVTTGVPQPKEHPAPMPPMGGAQLSAGEVCAVAAYVYRLSHK